MELHNNPTKSPAAQYVLQQLDAYEDAPNDFANLVKEAALKFSLPVHEVEVQLEPFI